MHDYLWAKQNGLPSRYPLMAHLLDTAGFANILWDHWLRDGLKDLIAKDLGPNARAYVAAAAGLHDIGKANPDFQGREHVNTSFQQPWMKEMRDLLAAKGLGAAGSATNAELMKRHDQASAAHLAKGRPGRQLSTRDLINSEWLAATSLGHHGEFDLPSKEQMTALASDRLTWKPVRDEITDAVLTAVGLHPGAPWPQASPITTILISGLVIIADRLASDQLSVVLPGLRMMSNSTLSTDMGAQWLSVRSGAFIKILRDRLGLYVPMADPLQQVLNGHSPRGVQKDAANAGDGLWVVMAPTGAGKTEAAMLRHGTSNERLIFCLPTMATTNAMAHRVAKMFEATPNKGSLEHSMRDLFDVAELGKDSGSCNSGLLPTDFLSQGSNRLLGPVSVGTIDQVLMGALSSKFTHLRLLTIANAHIVIDEAHLMDQYQTHLAANLFQWWGATGTKVTVLTATLPTWQRNKLTEAYYPPADEDEPLPPVQFPSQETREKTTMIDASRYLIDVTQATTFDPPAEHVRWVQRMRLQHPDARLGVVVNTVANAQNIAETLRLQGEDVVLLHSRMTAKHRNRQAELLERKAGKNRRGKRFVVVGTQVVEASLDIDLDALSTDSAPAASIVQRAGRVWRHYSPTARSKRVPGLRNLSVHIVYGGADNQALPYFSSELDRAKKFMKDRHYLVMPDDSQQYVEASAFDLDAVLADTSVVREREERRLHIRAATAVAAPIDYLVQPKASLAELRRLTRSSDYEAFTRLVKPPTASIIVMAPAKEGIPGSWTKSVSALESLTGRMEAGQALEGLVPVNGAIAAYVLDQQIQFNPAAPVLRGKIPVKVNNGRLRYDRVKGLYLLPA